MPTMKKASLKALIQKEIEAQIVENIDNEVVRKNQSQQRERRRLKK